MKTARRPTTGEWAVLGGGLLLALDLVALPWHRIRIGLGLAGQISIDKRAVEAPEAIYAILALAFATFLVALILIRITSTRPGPPTAAQLRSIRVGGATVFGLLLAKLLLNTDFLGPGSWLGVALAGVIACGAAQIDGAARKVPTREPPEKN